MGLDTTHNAFHGSYIAFNYFRKAVAAAIGGSYPPHDPSLRDENEKPLLDEMWYCDNDKATKETNPGLTVFFNHSDCGGYLTSNECQMIADEIEALLPEIDKQDYMGHTLGKGWISMIARQWVRGCRSAAKRKQKLTFK